MLFSLLLSFIMSRLSFILSINGRHDIMKTISTTFGNYQYDVFIRIINDVASTRKNIVRVRQIASTFMWHQKISLFTCIVSQTSQLCSTIWSCYSKDWKRFFRAIQSAILRAIQSATLFRVYYLRYSECYAIQSVLYNRCTCPASGMKYFCSMRLSMAELFLSKNTNSNTQQSLFLCSLLWYPKSLGK